MPRLLMLRHSPAALLVLATLSPMAAGQNALGDGRQLDSSLSTRSRYNATRIDPAAEYRFRNAVATGNAPGGLSLRADVGYRSPYEFRGDLGSDDLFSFRRDSMYSGLAGMGIRGTEAIQYQFAMTTGSQLPENLVGPGTVSRDGTLGLSGGLSTGANPLRRPTVQEMEESQRLTGMLRSPSSYTTTRSLRPVFLGNVADLTGDIQGQGVSASSLRGIRIIEMTGSEQAQLQRVRTVHDDILDSMRAKNQVKTSATEQGVEGEDESELKLPDWRDRLNDLRIKMLVGEVAKPETPAEPSETDPDTMEGDPVQRVVPVVPSAGSEEARPGIRFDPETLELIRSDGDPIESLIDASSTIDSIYVSHMESGQHLLSVGRYFDAEERFTRALSMRPGDVSAQVGRLHSQLGAGLFISAGMNLRELVMTSPEIAALKFAQGLLPSETRSAELVILLRERAGLVPEISYSDITLRRETALLLAYLSYQFGDADQIAEGLDAARKTLSDEEIVATGTDVRLIEYLSQLWTPAEPAEPEGE